MRTGVIAKKLGMARFFDEAGAHVPVTVLSLEGCQVVAHRTQDKDGYVALQLGAGSKKPKNTSKALRGHFAKGEVEPKHKVVEFRVSEDNLIDVGAEITADHFLAGQKVDTTFNTDVSYSVQIGWDTTLALTVQNLFDKDPEFSRDAINYDAFTGSPLGRTVRFGVRKRW